MSMMRKLMSKNRKGFTLIELIVVLAILGVILAIAVPRYNGLQEAAQLKADRSSAALIIKSARLMEANENIASDSDVVSVLGSDGALDVTANGIDSDITYYEADDNNVAETTGSNFILTYTGGVYTVEAGSFSFDEGDPVNSDPAE